MACVLPRDGEIKRGVDDVHIPAMLRQSGLRRYFHAYRIDHILGFFRIWEIPGVCSTGLLGHFRPSHPLTREELESHGIWDFDRQALLAVWR